MNNSVLEKWKSGNDGKFSKDGKWEKNNDIKLITTETTRNLLLSEINYHTTRLFSKNLLTIETKRTHILMNKLLY